MTQDFAKIRPEPLLERKPVEAPPAWSLMITGGLVGLVVGIFGSFLFCLSGNLPPLNIDPASTIAGVNIPETPEPEALATEQVIFEF